MNRTDLGGWNSINFFGTGAYSTGSFTPPANSLLVVFVSMMGNGTSGDLGTPTISGGGLTFTLRGSARSDVSWSRRVNVFTAPVGASPSSMTVTVDDNDNHNIFTYGVAAIAYTDYNTGAPVAGWVDSGTGDIGDGANTLTLSATPTTNDESVIVTSADAATAPNNPTMAAGWTKIYDVAVPDGGASLVVATRASSISTTASITDVYTAAGTFYNASMVAFIVSAAASGVVVAPGTVTVKTAAINPIIILGSITITPGTVTAKTSAINPTIILGLITIAPAAALVQMVVSGPVVLGGGVTVTPAGGVVRVAIKNPIVIGGGGINPLGEGDSPGLLVFMLASSIYRNLQAQGLISGIGLPDADNAGDWDNYLFS